MGVTGDKRGYKWVWNRYDVTMSVNGMWQVGLWHVVVELHGSNSCAAPHPFPFPFSKVYTQQKQNMSVNGWKLTRYKVKSIPIYPGYNKTQHKW